MVSAISGVRFPQSTQPYVEPVPSSPLASVPRIAPFSTAIPCQPSKSSIRCALDRGRHHILTATIRIGMATRTSTFENPASRGCLCGFDDEIRGTRCSFAPTLAHDDRDGDADVRGFARWIELLHRVMQPRPAVAVARCSARSARVSGWSRPGTPRPSTPTTAPTAPALA